MHLLFVFGYVQVYTTARETARSFVHYISAKALAFPFGACYCVCMEAKKQTNESTKAEGNTMTAKQVADKIVANCKAWADSVITFEEFEAEQFKLWGYADTRSAQFVDMVSSQARASG